MLSFSENTKHILISGAKGVGKTTLLKSPKIDKKFKIVIYSELLKSSAKRVFGKNFLKLNSKERDTLRESVANDILNGENSSMLLWEIHACCYEFGEKRVVVPRNLLKASSFIILITLNDLTLKERRANDLSKKRSYSQKIIRRDSRVELEAVRKLSKKYRKPFALFHNDQPSENSLNNFNNLLNKINS